MFRFIGTCVPLNVFFYGFGPKIEQAPDSVYVLCNEVRLITRVYGTICEQGLVREVIVYCTIPQSYSKYFIFLCNYYSDVATAIIHRFVAFSWSSLSYDMGPCITEVYTQICVSDKVCNIIHDT